jgi:hypothetical protein
VVQTAAERYIHLGLQLGRHDDSVVDAYFGPPELAAAVEQAPAAEPPALVAAADALLNELPDGWLRDQVAGLRTFAGVLAGETLAYADEVAGCYGVRATHTDEAVFAAAHERLADLLPGADPPAERYRRWRDSMLVPPDRIERTVAAVIEEARTQTRRLVDLPDGEEVSLDMVRGESWLGYNFYLGDLRGRVAVNVDLPMSAIDLLDVALHEAYPGHQAERACKEQLLVRGRGLIEETIVLAPTPQSVVSEGIGRLAPFLLLEGDGADAFAGILRGAGVKVDLAQAVAVERTAEPCRWTMINVALMLHEQGVSVEEARSYLLRWGILPTDLADHVIRFLTQPSSRTYAIAYPAGLELCRAYVAAAPHHLRRLLTEQVRVRDLVAARWANANDTA